MKLFIVIILISPGALHANARDDGDKMRIYLPATAALSSLLIKDIQGLEQLSLGLLVATGATESLKFISQERRPNGECCESFPSGHTSIAFSSAAYIHHRYGLGYSIPFYLGASYVGYSRVFANSHYSHDVLAGTAVGIASAWASTTAFQNRPIALIVNQRYAGILYRKIWD